MIVLWLSTPSNRPQASAHKPANKEAGKTSVASHDVHDKEREELICSHVFLCWELDHNFLNLESKLVVLFTRPLFEMIKLIKHFRAFGGNLLKILHKFRD